MAAPYEILVEDNKAVLHLSLQLGRYFDINAAMAKILAVENFHIN